MLNLSSKSDLFKSGTKALVGNTFKKLKALEDISYVCSNLYTSDLESAATQVIKPFCELAGADVGVVMILKNPDKQIYIVASYGLSEGFIETYNNKLRYTLNSDCVTENWPSIRSVYKKKIVLIKDTDKMRVEYSKFFKESLGVNKIKSVASVPIIINNDAIGAISLYYTNQPDFNDEELSFMKTTANIITGTIERNHLLEAAKKSEKELAEANEDLQQINQELDSFVYIASHDLREPLRTIESFISVIQDQFKNSLEDKLQEYLLRIIKATKRMRKLIEDLTQLSRVSRETKDKENELVDLNVLITEVQFELTAFLQDKNAQIVLTSESPKVLGNKEKTASIFKNLITNGIKFNKSKEKKVEISLVNNPNLDHKKICICVKDNGIGIPKEYYEKIFGLFQRLHSQDEYEGTGAGLAIVKKILEKYNCEIWVESEKDKGSKFYFTLIKGD